MFIYTDMLLFIQFYMVIQTVEPVLKSERYLKRGQNADTSKYKCKFWNRHREMNRNTKAQTHEQTDTDTHTHTHTYTQTNIYTHTNTHLYTHI